MRTLFATLLIALVTASSASVRAQDDAEQQPIILTEFTTASINKVYRTIQTTLAEIGCPKPQAFTDPTDSPDDGPRKGKWVSEYCMLQEGTDSVKAYIKKYSELPRIRGGIWTTCRVQYTFNIKDVEEGKVKIILRAQMSGYEEFITQTTHFWPSNGVLERDLMSRLLANLSASTK